METSSLLIPEISDELLAERLSRIKFVSQAMQGIDGNIYPTEETDKRLFDLFYVESQVDPRTQSFNFDEKRKFTAKASDIIPLETKDIYIKVGGYYGYLKMTMAEVLAQIPETIADQVVAFGLNPEKNAQVIDGGNHQVASIIFYGKATASTQAATEELPSASSLILPINLERAERLKHQIHPMLNYNNEGIFSIDPGDVSKPFIEVGIWIRVNGSNLHRTNTETKLRGEYIRKQKVSVYQAFTDGADFYRPTYSSVISQIPDELLTENTIGLLYYSTDYFKAKEGVIHKTEFTLIEKA